MENENNRNIFCKIFEINGKQVLVRRGFDADTEEEIIELATTTIFGEMTKEYIYNNFQDAEHVFALFGEEHAMKFLLQAREAEIQFA